MSTRGKKSGARGRGRGKAKAAAVAAQEEEITSKVGEDSVISAEEDVSMKEKENDEDTKVGGDVPELDDGPPPPTISTPIRSTVRLNSSSLSAMQDVEEDMANDVKDDEVQEVPISTEDMTNDVKDDEVQEVPMSTEEGLNGLKTELIESDVEDVEMEEKEGQETAVKDAEMVSEDELQVESKEPLETEAVSDEELQESQNADLPETEAVSDDELPKEERKKAKVAEAEAVSEDELPEENEKKEVAEKETNGETPATDEVKVDGKRKLPEGEYDPSSPTSEVSEDGAPAAKKAAVADDKSATPKPVAKKVLPELDKYWKTVKDDPSDFTGWTYLLQYVEQENETDVAREAYNAFLSHYPYCYGYWRKYADFEKRKGNVEACEEVFDRGLKAIPLSVDLWLHYINYVKAAKAEDPDYVRSQYERAVTACGLEFRSDRLWESFLKWEKEKKNLINITALYDRLLAIPTQNYTTHFDNFQDHVNNNPPQTILPLDDFLEIRREVVNALKSYEKPSIAPGEDAPPGDDSADVDKEDSVVSVTTRMEEETTALRGKILATRRKVYKATVGSVAARWNYEEGIKRPYFHVKPLERCQLKNWKEYLDYEIEQGNRDRIIILFERCLIACALYEEFWVRFIRFLEMLPGENTEKIRHVYERACLIHHRKKPNLHLQWAVFEESKGNYDKAANILEAMEKTTPNMLQVAYRRINLERRRGELACASKLYEEYIEANKTNKPVLTNFTVKYARFLWKLMGDVDRAIEVLEGALEADKENTRLYLQLIDMALQKTPVDEDKVVAILDQFLEKEGDPEQKTMFAQRKIEFLEDFGTSIDRVQKAQDEFQKFVKQIKEKKKKTTDTAESTSTHSATTSTTSSSTAHIPKVESKPAAKTTTPATASHTAAPAITNPPPSFPPQGYPPNFYGQYPPPAAAADPSATPAPTAAPYNNPSNPYPGYNNYSNWNNYPQGSYGNYGQPGWPGYYPNY